MQNEYCLYKENIATPEIFKEYLNRAIDYFINNDFHIRQASTLSEEQIDSTSNKLRPEWDNLMSIIKAWFPISIKYNNR